MAWKPWYDRMAEMDSAEEREEFLKGVFGPPPIKGKQAAGIVMTGLLAGWGAGKILKRPK